MLRYQSGSAVARGPAAPALSKIKKIEWDQPNDTGVINPHKGISTTKTFSENVKTVPVCFFHFAENLLNSREHC